MFFCNFQPKNCHQIWTLNKPLNSKFLPLFASFLNNFFRQSLTARLEPPKKAITRTLSQDPFYTHRNPYQPPNNPQNNYNHNNYHQNNNNFNGNHNNNHRNNHNSQSHSSSIPRISEMPVNSNSHFSTPTNPAYTQGNLRIQKNKKSLFSLWGHQDTTSVAPTQKSGFKVFLNKPCIL